MKPKNRIKLGQRGAAFLMLVIVLFTGRLASALPSYGVNCTLCHTTPETGITLTNFQSVTNLGAGLLKVFQVSAGQTAAIQIYATNNNGGNYGLNINSLGSAGVSNANHHMVFTPDPMWTSQSGGTYFTVGPVADIPNLWTFALAVDASTPPDFYPVQVIMAGWDGDATWWSQPESFYVQVVVAPPTFPGPTLLAARYASNTFSLQAATTSGHTYYLEYKTSLTSTNWTTASQLPGDGSVKTFMDGNATDAQRYYRLRVQ